jgi:uncharacterized protein (TIGR02996 family)
VGQNRIQPPSDDAAFVAATQATPPDDDSRLVYADWLEDRSDPRGEFIRVQAEMADLPVYSDRYVNLKKRRRALQAQVDADWCRAMGYVPRHRPLFTRLPQPRVERWRLVEEFIDVWHGPLEANDGYSEAELMAAEKRLGLRLPAALREWYALAGKRKGVWSTADNLLSPDRLRLDQDRDGLVFRTENQASVMWAVRATDLNLEDPPIFEIYENVQASPTTTAFAIQVLLHEAQFGTGVLSAGGSVDERHWREALERDVSKCDLPDRYWIAHRFWSYEGADILFERTARAWLNVAARTEQALEQLGPDVLGQLERYT